MNGAPQVEAEPVLVLGGGINGCAIARELLLNDIPVVLVERRDIASGTTAKSSRLIHGGLRYLEYAELDLVRESLEERGRLIRTAPHHVKPLRLYIPVARRTGGLLRAACRFTGCEGWGPVRWLLKPLRLQRGLWVTRLGLRVYDRFARDRVFPPRGLHAVAGRSGPHVDCSTYRWLCSYSDAQMPYPERFCIALLQDACRIAAERRLGFQVWPYHSAVLREGVASIRGTGAAPEFQFRPPQIVNATGAWGDFTLRELAVPSRTLFGGTKGSHFVTFHQPLRDALNGAAVYAEAPDGRLVFVLPFEQGVLVGTTDEHFEQDPAEAVASREELEYLLAMTNNLFPTVQIGPEDVAMHYSGVRPLPDTRGPATSAITRRHWIERHELSGVPVFTIVGGKLTTCRSLAEQLTETILRCRNRSRTTDSRERVVPGSEDYPADAEELERRITEIARTVRIEPRRVRAIWALCGTRTAEVCREMGCQAGGDLDGTSYPREFVRWVIRNEWVTCLEDLVERRLLLIYRPTLSLLCLSELAELLSDEGLLRRDRIPESVQSYRARLRRHYGREVLSR